MKKYLLTGIVLVFAFISGVAADTLKVTERERLYSDTANVGGYYKTLAGYEAHCSQHYKEAPPVGTYCTLDEYFLQTENDKVAIGYIIADPDGGLSGGDYRFPYQRRDVLINLWLAKQGYTYDGREGIKSNACSEGTAERTKYINYCQPTYVDNRDKYKVTITNFTDKNGNLHTGYYEGKVLPYVEEYKKYRYSISIGTMAYNSTNGKYEGTVTLTGVTGNDYTVTANNCTASNKTSTSFTLSCDLSSQTVSSYTGTVSIYFNTGFYSAYAYNCGSNYQELILQYTRYLWKTMSGSFAVTLNTSFYIEKIDEREQPLAGATFYLFSNTNGGSDYSTRTSYYCTSDNNGICTFTNIPLNRTYAIRETQAPTGYKKANGVVASVNTSTVARGGKVGADVTNEDGCGSLFNYYNNDGTAITMTERIQIYNKFKSEDLRAVLNTNNTTAEQACKTKTISYENSTSCFSGNYKYTSLENFTYNDISNYDEEIILTQNAQTIKGFCLTGINFDGQSTIQTDTHSGRILYYNSSDPITATTSTLTKKCYLYTTSDNGTVTQYTSGLGSATGNKELTYNKYVKNVKFGVFLQDNSKLDLYSFNNTSISSQTLKYNGSFRMHAATITQEYKFPEIWATKGAAEIYNSNSECTTKNPKQECTKLGYGLSTKFTSKYRVYAVIRNNKYVNANKFIFSYDSCVANCSDTNSSFQSNEGYCEYLVTPQIVQKNPSNLKQELQLEFRTVKRENPFPGKSADGRNVGSNWEGSNANKSSSCNETILRNITYRPDSSGYGYDASGNRVKMSKAKYEITLTPEMIEDIRKDNETGINYEYDKFYTNTFICAQDKCTLKTIDSSKSVEIAKNDIDSYLTYANKFTAQSTEFKTLMANSKKANGQPCVVQEKYVASTDKHTASEFSETGYLVDTLTENKTKLTAKSSTGLTYNNKEGVCITDTDPEKGYWIVYKLVNSATDKNSYSNYKVSADIDENDVATYYIHGDKEPALNPNHVYYLRADVTMTDESCDGGSKNKTAKFRFSNYYHIDPLNPKYGSSVFGYGNPVVNLDITQKLLSENNNKVSILLYGGWQSKESAPCDITYTTAASPNRNRNCYAGGADAIQIGTMPRACGVKVCFKNIVILDLNEYFSKDYTEKDATDTLRYWLDNNVNIDNYITYTLGNN